jgi:hypothetical protein
MMGWMAPLRHLGAKLMVIESAEGGDVPEGELPARGCGSVGCLSQVLERAR